MILENSNIDIKERKEQLRQAVNCKARRLSSKVRLKESRAIQKKLEAQSLYKKAQVIMFYWALPLEVDTKDLIRKARIKGKIVVLPVLTKDNEMKAYEYTEKNSLVKSPLGFWGPDPKKARQIDAEDLDIVITPGLAFDKSGNRLGRGKGCYDRFLKKLDSKTYKIGLAFRFQILDSLAFSFQDERLDLVISG